MLYASARLGCTPGSSQATAALTRQKAKPLHGKQLVAAAQSAVTRPGTGNRSGQTENQQGGWQKDLAFRFGVYRKF